MTSVSNMSQMTAQIEILKSLQAQMGTLQTQLSSGKKTQLFKGLGFDVITSERSRAIFKQLENYEYNINTADRRMKMMSNSTEKIKQQVANLSNALQIQTQAGDIELESIGELAGKVRDLVANLLNEKDGDRYLFSGAETLSQPLTTSGTLDTYVQTQIDGWVNGTITNDQFIQSFSDRGQLTDTIMGYSVPLSSGNTKGVYVRIDTNTDVEYTMLANEDGFRDVLAVASMLEHMSQTLDEITLDADDPPGTVTAPGGSTDQQSTNFFAAFNEMALMLSNALDSIESSEFNLAQSQIQMSQEKENIALEKSVMQSTIDSIENADMNEVAMKITALQVQLEASYRVTALTSNLNLVSFMGAV